MTFLPDRIYWQAHRGGGRNEAPDNTLYAMEYAWELGGIPEADIRVTADREIICLHDDTLARTTNAPPEISNISIGDLSYEEICGLDAGIRFRADCAGQHVPRLAEVFSRMKNDPCKILYADIKNYDERLFPILMEGFLSLVQEYGVASQVIVAGCDYNLNCRFKDMMPDLKTMQWIGYWGNLDPAEEKIRQFQELERVNFAKLDLVQMHLYYRENAGPGEWIYDITREELKYLYSCLHEKLEVFPLGPFTEESIRCLVRMGIRQFATDEPQRFLSILNTIQ